MKEADLRILRTMVSLYCRGHHPGAQPLCRECEGLLTYGAQRLAACRYGERKPPCGSCKSPCWSQEKRERIKQVMRYSGPRMILRGPGALLTHLFRTALHVWKYTFPRRLD